jgi:hypothetical protein
LAKEMLIAYANPAWWVRPTTLELNNYQSFQPDCADSNQNLSSVVVKIKSGNSSNPGRVMPLSLNLSRLVSQFKTC